jgi:hypothetical protein
LDVDHSWAGDANDGKHQQVTLRPITGAVTADPGDGVLFSAAVSGNTELFYLDSGGRGTQITFSGSVLPGAIVGTSLNISGNGTITGNETVGGILAVDRITQYSLGVVTMTSDLNFGGTNRIVGATGIWTDTVNINHTTGNWTFSVDSSDDHFVTHQSGWFEQWQSSTHARFWMSPTQELMQLDASGNLAVHGSVTPGGVLLMGADGEKIDLLQEIVALRARIAALEKGG